MAKITVTCECGHTAEYDESEIHSHRLICGDSTDVAVIDRLMNGVKAELLLTDPPYGINVVRGAHWNRQLAEWGRSRTAPLQAKSEGEA